MKRIREDKINIHNTKIIEGWNKNAHAMIHTSYRMQARHYSLQPENINFMKGRVNTLFSVLLSDFRVCGAQHIFLFLQGRWESHRSSVYGGVSGCIDQGCDPSIVSAQQKHSYRRACAHLISSWGIGRCVLGRRRGTVRRRAHKHQASRDQW